MREGTGEESSRGARGTENKLLADNRQAPFGSRGVYYLLQRLHFSR